MRAMTSARQPCARALSFALSTTEAITAQGSAPRSEPAKRAFLQLSAIGRIDPSTTFVSISTRPSSRNRQEARSSAQRIADRFGELALLADEGELVAQLLLKGCDDGEDLRIAAGAPFLGRRPRISPSMR